MDLQTAWRETHRLRITKAVENFRQRGFEAHGFETSSEASAFFFSDVKPDESIGHGGSDTTRQLGVMDRLRGGDYHLLDRTKFGHTYHEQLDIRRENLSADVFVASSNAVSIGGALVNVDGDGNRIAALNFGPGRVYLFIGRNKLCDDLEKAIYRARNVASVALAVRLEKKTPCTKTGTCHDCAAPERICNYFSIIERCNPAGRIKLLFINEDLGL